ncbi:MAG TPA: PEP-CTERM sorting domain-containing protein [Armatimonadota bacterium]|jgi:hypothetical protein
MRISIWAALAGCALLFPATGRCGITLITDFDGNGVQPAVTIFRQPSFSGSTGGFLAATPNLAATSTSQASSGTKSLNVQWAFKDTGVNDWLRLTTSGYNPVIDAGGALTMKVLLTSNDPLQVCLGVRERVYTSDPPLGSIGAGSGSTIEWVGATGKTSGAPVCTHTITPGAWQDLTFIIPSEPIFSFNAGNGVINPTFGKVDLEHLAFRIPGGSANPVNLYIDDIQTRSLDTIPEPGTLALLVTGLLPLLGLRRRTR